MARRRVVVVGGGLAGLCAAAIAQRHGASVTLLEQGSEVGGLLRSVALGEAGWFDLGTHIPTFVGDPEIDEEVVGVLPDSALAPLREPAAGTYSFGQLRPGTNWPDLRGLPAELYRRGIDDLLHQPAPTGEAKSCADGLRRRLGTTFANEAVLPVLRHLCGEDPESLAPGSERLLGLSRFVCFTPEVTAALKTNPRFDEAIAFHDQRIGSVSVRRVYPQRGGVGAWTRALADRLVDRGVIVRTGIRLGAVTVSDGAVTAVSLEGGEQLDVDGLIWTVPLVAFRKACGMPVSGPRPAFRRVHIQHLVSDAPPATDRWYLTCFDTAVRSFRVTLYTNLAGDVGPLGHRLTVESLLGPEQSPATVEELRAELVTMGILPDGARLREVGTHDETAGFPVPHAAFRERLREQLAEARHDVRNARFVGKATAEEFVMPDVMRAAARAAHELA
jgi:protoporphyrinogen oxidase